MNIHMPITSRTQGDTEYSVYNLFQDIRDLLSDAKDPLSRANVQENIEDLIEAREVISAIIKEVSNG
ncbi:hypothetical protein JY97_00490 [Alkalispirochaeta odontotermitis]|nr:hypothetical protein JY97_00490 [Alkalispirochaeta odontotermitis]